MEDWVFFFCIQCVSAFYKVRDLHRLYSWLYKEYKTIEYQNKRLDILKKGHCYTSQSLSSSFDKFSFMMNKYKFSIVALSKT